MATESRDVIPTSMAALMMCSPDRINELFRLSVNCEHEALSDGAMCYGLRWWSSKGAPPMIKWIPTEMVDVAKTAISKLQVHTEEARRMALWYENNPGVLYLPEELEYLRECELVSASDVRNIIGLSTNSGACCWARESGVIRIVGKQFVSKGDSMAYWFAFKDIESAVVAMLPSGFPLFDKASKLNYGNTLLIVPKNLFHPNRATYRCMFEEITTDTFNNQLGASVMHGKSSVFSRLGFVDEDGNDFKISSHQFRHLLNTIAQKKNVGQLVIALWSSRKDVKQNSAYDHRTPDEILEMLRQFDTSSLSNVPVVIKEQTPITRKQFMELKYPTVHTTPFGFCVHDYSMLPCQKFRACLDCTEHRCIKGDTEKTERVRQCLAESEEQLARDEEALAEGYIGADKWLELNRKRVERLRNLVQIFDDSEVPEGTFIELNIENEYSPIGLAINERMLLGNREGRILKQVHDLKSRRKLDSIAKREVLCHK